ncbi:MAG: hypothetical protein ACYC1C_17140 [Chloroflexota bacterium]
MLGWVWQPVVIPANISGLDHFRNFGRAKRDTLADVVGRRGEGAERLLLVFVLEDHLISAYK